MIKVKVTFVGLVQRLVGCREEVFLLPRESTLGELLEQLVARFGPAFEERVIEDGDLGRQANVLINGYNALGQGGLLAKLANGSKTEVQIVMLAPPLMGG